MWDNTRSAFDLLQNTFGGIGTNVGANSQIGNAALVVNQLNLSGAGDIITASSSGTTEFKVSNAGVVTASSFQDLQNTAYFLDPAATGISLLTAGGAGIAMATPSAHLDVGGITDNAATGDTMRVWDHTLSGYMFADYISIGTATPYAEVGSWSLSNNSYENFVIPGGNVGIETTKPSYPLDVGGSNSSTDTVRLGNVLSGAWPSNTIYSLIGGTAALSQSSVGNYAVLQSNAGQTFVNAASGQSINFRINNADKMIIASSGNVGIGTTNPAGPLDITSSGGGGLFVDGVNTLDDLSGTTYLKANSGQKIYFQIPNGTNRASIDGSGNLRLAGVVTCTSCAPDIAENITVSDLSINAGDIISADTQYSIQASKSHTPYDQTMLGVISTKPGITLNSGIAPDATNAAINQKPLVLGGRVPIKVWSRNGALAIGDHLTSSQLPGFGIKAAQAGFVVATALEPFIPTDGACSPVASVAAIHWPTDDGSNPTKPCFSLPDGTFVGKIMAFVKVAWYDPDVYLTDTGNLRVMQNGSNPNNYALVDSGGNPINRVGAFSDIASANLRGGKIEAKQITTDSLSIASSAANIIIAGQSLHDYISQTVAETLTGGLAVNTPGGGGNLFTASSAGVPKFVIQNNGNIGIGISTPLFPDNL